VIDLEKLIADAVAAELDRRGIHAKPANDVETITVAAYCERYSISESTVRVAIREGRLEHIRIGRAVRIPPNAKIAKRESDATTKARLILMRGGKVGR
jgi:excisionase family DNA binding protein